MAVHACYVEDMEMGLDIPSERLPDDTGHIHVKHHALRVAFREQVKTNCCVSHVVLGNTEKAAL